MRKTLSPIIGIFALAGPGCVVWRTAAPVAAPPGVTGSAAAVSTARTAGQAPLAVLPQLPPAQAPSSDSAVPLPRPAVFGFGDAREALSPAQRTQITEIETRFLDEVSGLDPARPDDFRRRWRLAVQTADQDFRLRFGSVAYVQFNHDQGRDLAGP